MPICSQLAQRPGRIVTGHERPHMDASGQATGQDFGRAVEPDREAAAVQQPAVAGVDDAAPAGGDDTAQLWIHIGWAEREHGLALMASEAGLSLLGEDVGHDFACAPFHEFVEIYERGVMSLGDTTPHRALATSRQADEHEVHRAT